MMTVGGAEVKERVSCCRNPRKWERSCESPCQGQHGLQLNSNEDSRRARKHSREAQTAGHPSRPLPERAEEDESLVLKTIGRTNSDLTGRRVSGKEAEERRK